MSDVVIVALISGGLPLIGTIVTVLVTAIGNRKALSKEVKDVKKTVEEHIEDNKKDSAVQARARILRFRNDLRHGNSFDEDYWNAILRDITDYNNYCDSHPKFPNEICLHAISFIEKKYDELLYINGFEIDE